MASCNDAEKFASYNLDISGNPQVFISSLWQVYDSGRRVDGHCEVFIVRLLIPHVLTPGTIPGELPAMASKKENIIY
uniref:Uncharacterized protein n=1 Tax=Pristionchus pacificus TaxID=54126 RepID=A0A2A6CW32_PRIPA|eukprot:PDM82257.1 hypothetical protein PRIPAC_36650 [Pristionchus pacificus]